MDGLTLDQLLVFQSVSAEGSFSAAARKLGRVQSAVSYSVNKLEENLGLPLFDRSERRPVLTEGGRALLPDVHAVHQQVEALRRRASSIGMGIEATVAVVIDSFLPIAVVFPILKRFEERFPDTRLQLRDENLGGVPSLVDQGRCDLGFGLGLWPGSELVQDEFASVEMVTLVGGQHALAQREGIVDRESLHQFTQIVVTDRSEVTSGTDHGVFSRTTWRVSDLRTKLALIEAGFGFGSVPAHACVDSLSRGRVKLLRFEGREAGTFRIPISSMERSAHPPGPAGRWLADEIKKAICSWSSG